MKGTRAGGGEIVQVQGGHILRSTGKKDRHSKVYTSKGPRDRRVRLSAHTAIQFYDVQDRLGYDRPSKAVDWLIHKAKNAIDKLDQLPPWQPNIGITNSPPSADSSEPPLDHPPEMEITPSGYPSPLQFKQTNNNPGSSNFPYLPAEPLLNTMKTLSNFPDFQNEEPVPISTPFMQAEDLGLSLHTRNSALNYPMMSFQDSFQRMVEGGWNGTTAGDKDMVGFLMNSQAMFSQGLPPFSLQPNEAALHHASWYGRAPQSSDFADLGFRVPARIHGVEESESGNE